MANSSRTIAAATDLCGLLQIPVDRSGLQDSKKWGLGSATSTFSTSLKHNVSKRPTCWNKTYFVSKAMCANYLRMSRPWERLSSHKISLLATATTRSTRELSTWQALIVGWIRGRLLRTVRTGDTAEPKQRCSWNPLCSNLSAGKVFLTQKNCLTPLDLSESFNHVWDVCLKYENPGEK